jgi:hypothetical protein
VIFVTVRVSASHLTARARPREALATSESGAMVSLSLVSAILQPMSSLLRLIPAVDFTNWSWDHIGPRFPVRNPPGDSDSSVISAMVDLLLCDDDPTRAFYFLASLLGGNYGCQLKLFDIFFCLQYLVLMLHRHPEVRFPEPCCSVSTLDIGFALVPEWQPTTETMIRRPRIAPLCFSCPALAIGIQLEEARNEPSGLTSQDLLQVAHATQPHLEALLVARHQLQRCPVALPATIDTPSIPHCIYGVVFRNATVFIVAHIPYGRPNFHCQILPAPHLKYKPHSLSRYFLPSGIHPGTSYKKIRALQVMWHMFCTQTSRNTQT